MEKVLVITANPKPESHSHSLAIAHEFLKVYQQHHSSDEIVEINLYKTYVPEIDEDVLNGWEKLEHGTAFEDLTAEEKAKVGRIDELTNQFIAADKYVFVTPMWNLSVPPRMKAYIDAVCVAGKTFRYTEEGSVGLLTNKKAVHIQARGGIYSKAPQLDMEFGDRYLRKVLNFIGVDSIDSVILEGMSQMPHQAESIKESTIERAREAAACF